MKKSPNLQLVTSTTTRPKRPGEKDGDIYHFLTKQKFEEKINSGEFLEWVKEDYNELYGTLRSDLEKSLKKGPAIMEIEVRGAEQVRDSKIPHCSIFILPPSFEELVRRIRERRTERGKVLSRRLSQARNELKEASRYDYRVVNDNLEQAIQEVENIIQRYLKSRG